MIIKIFTLLAVVVASPFVLVPYSLAGDIVQFQLATEHVDMTTFYDGTTIAVNGTAPADSSVVLEVSGPKQDVHLKEKGKVFGFLWMNKTDVALENAPADYMIYTPDSPDQNLLGLKTGIGYAAIEQDITVMPETENKDFIFGEFVKLMEKSGVYSINKGAVTYGEVQAGVKPFSATLIIPSKMKPGEYHVKAIAIQNGSVVDKVQTNLVLQLKGFPAMISYLAYDKSLLFGFLAVGVAVAVGLIIGTLFKGGKGAH